jgi:hypothetical protein
MPNLLDSGVQNMISEGRAGFGGQARLSGDLWEICGKWEMCWGRPDFLKDAMREVL